MYNDENDIIVSAAYKGEMFWLTKKTIINNMQHFKYHSRLYK